MKADQTFDCRGLTCVAPIVKTAERIKQMKSGEILEIIFDDQGIKLHMPPWREATGHKLVGFEKKRGKIGVNIKKLDEGNGCMSAAQRP